VRCRTISIHQKLRCLMDMDSGDHKAGGGGWVIGVEWLEATRRRWMVTEGVTGDLPPSLPGRLVSNGLACLYFLSVLKYCTFGL
jgi:hypothetical protein